MATTTYNRTYGDDSGFPSTRPIYAVPDITTGILAEYDPDSLGTVGTDITAFAATGGSMGSAANLTSFSTSKPTVLAGPNGHKAVRAVGASSQFMRTAVFGTQVNLPLTQVFVLRRQATATMSLFSGYTVTGGSASIGMRWTAAGYDAGAGTTGELVNSYAAADTASYHVLIIRHGANANLSIDGVSAAGVTGQAAAAFAYLPRFTFFTNSSAATTFATVDLAFARMYGRGLTDQDIGSLAADLKTKYATP